MATIGLIQLNNDVPSYRSFAIKNADGTDRNLSGLTPILQIRNATDAGQLFQFWGATNGSTTTFTIAGLTTATTPAGEYPLRMQLWDSGDHVVADGWWTGTAIVDGGGQFITLDDLKGYLGITHTEDDLLLWQSIKKACGYFTAQTGCYPLFKTYTDIQDGSGGRAVYPDNYPVLSVSSLTINGTTVPVSSAYDSNGYYIDGNALKLRGLWVPSGQGNVSVTYTAGYSSVPQDIQSCVTKIAATLYREPSRLGRQSETTPTGGSTTFYYTAPADVVATIEAYRRILG